MSLQCSVFSGQKQEPLCPIVLMTLLYFINAASWLVLHNVQQQEPAWLGSILVDKCAWCYPNTVTCTHGKRDVVDKKLALYPVWSSLACQQAVQCVWERFRWCSSVLDLLRPDEKCLPTPDKGLLINDIIIFFGYFPNPSNVSKLWTDVGPLTIVIGPLPAGTPGPVLSATPSVSIHSIFWYNQT